MYKKSLLLFVFLCFFLTGFSQKKRPTLENTIDSILVKRPLEYKKISYYLRYFRRDTTKLKQLIPVFDKASYYVGKSYVENFLGIRYRNFSLYQKAIKTHKQALLTAKKAKSIEFQVFSLNMIGVDYRSINSNRKALDYNQEALALAETVKNPNLGLRRSIAVSHNSMGNIYLLLRQYDLAIDQLNQSQVFEKSINNRLGLAINYQNIGELKGLQGKTDEALQYYQKSLAINIELNNKIGKTICNGSIANIYIKQGKLHKALVLLKTNLPIVKSLGNKKHLAYGYLDLGWVQTKLNKYTIAEENLLNGVNLSRESGLHLEVSTGYKHLSELYQQKNNFKKSLSYYKKAIELEEKFSNELNIRYVNDLILKYDSDKKNNQIKTLAKENEISKLQLNRSRFYWFVSLCLFILLGVVLYTLYKHKLLKNEQKITALEQDALRSQMNPHFIFNALNSIKLYIINNEQKNAVRYLNKFSKLMRRILEVSAIKDTSLALELETMDLYMGIENIRFSNDIGFEISVHPAIDLESINVPPLILQPFLENSLWHGLSSKKENKKIILSVVQPDKNHIQIIIEDNGIGREAAAKIKAKKIIHRQSIGIKLTKERLENYVKEYTHSFSLTYEDLKDNKNNPTGTKVILLIPLH